MRGQLRPRQPKPTASVGGAATNDGAPTDQVRRRQPGQSATLQCISRRPGLQVTPSRDPPPSPQPIQTPTPNAAAAPTAAERARSIKATTETQSTAPNAATAKPAISASPRANQASLPGDDADTSGSSPRRTLALAAGGHGRLSMTRGSQGDAAASAALAGQSGPPAQITAASIPPAAAALAQAHGADITAQLAAQMTSRAGAARSAFDFALEPQGLGRVDVSLKIDQQGQLSAVLSFDNPAAAAEAKGRAADLQQALQQAGLNVSQNGLSFTSGGGQGQGAAWQTPTQASYAPGSSAGSDLTTDPSNPAQIRSAASPFRRRRSRHHHLRSGPCERCRPHHHLTPPPATNTQTSSASASTLGVNNGLASLADNFQSFLSLLTTQLQNQDPLNPTDTNQFTEQITQMTGVEQQLMSNQLLQQLITQQTGRRGRRPDGRHRHGAARR